MKKFSMSDTFDGMEFYYQNIFDLNHGLNKREILTRFPSMGRDFGLENFFGEISALDSIDIAVKQLELASKIYEVSSVVCSVNIDNSVWLSDSLTARLIRVCEAQPHPVMLEFTELRPMPPADEANAVFLELRGYGVQLALDDFGAGLNGISVLADYNFDTVKLDRKLSTGLKGRPQKLKILAHVFELLLSLKKSHVVEGVEDEDQLKSLIDLGFTVFQGFLFHRPASVEEIL